MAIAAGMTALMAVDLWFQPLGRWDAWAQWTAKARVIYLFHGLAPSILSTSPYYAMNPDYPTLLPALEASDFTFMGSIDTRVIHVQFWLLFAATVIGRPGPGGMKYGYADRARCRTTVGATLSPTSPPRRSRPAAAVP